MPRPHLSSSPKFPQIFNPGIRLKRPFNFFYRRRVNTAFSNGNRDIAGRRCGITLLLGSTVFWCSDNGALCRNIEDYIYLRVPQLQKIGLLKEIAPSYRDDKWNAGTGLGFLSAVFFLEVILGGGSSSYFWLSFNSTYNTKFK